jgi:flagellar biogenesis protein FliO
MRRVGESVKHQSANLLMSLALAFMLLILFGVWLNERLRRQIEAAPLCECGLPQGHCQWCRQGES